MIELNSTPIVLMIILGVAGMLIPVINIARKENMSVIAVHALENEVMGVNNLYQLALAEKYFQYN